MEAVEEVYQEWTLASQMWKGELIDGKQKATSQGTQGRKTEQTGGGREKGSAAAWGSGCGPCSSLYRSWPGTSL